MVRSPRKPKKWLFPGNRWYTSSYPRHLGTEIGFFSVFHSWNQRLQFHPHVDHVIAAGGLAPDHAKWISTRCSFFLPIGVLSHIFRGKVVAGFCNAFHQGTLQFHGEVSALQI